MVDQRLHDGGKVLAAVVGAAALLVGASVGLGQASPGGPGTYQHMDYGPVIAQTVTAEWPEGNTAYKGLAIRLEHDAAVVFDTDLLRYATGTVGGWVDLLTTDLAAAKGSTPAATEGRLIFATGVGPGWSHPEQGTFADPRPDGLGNLPREHGRYEGYYRHGDRVVLSYSVGQSRVLEMPTARKVGEQVALVRQMRVGPGHDRHETLLAQATEADAIRSDERLVLLRNEQRTLAVMLLGGEGAVVALREADEPAGVSLVIEPSEAAVDVRVAIAELPAEADAAAAEALMAELEDDEAADLEAMTAGGPARWDQTLRTEGELGEDDWAYAVDTITLPMENPWNAWFRLIGFDFFEGGDRAAVTTLNGDVWIVEGIDDSLSDLRWRRFASGLYLPGGLCIVDEEIYVLERGQLTRLHDLNGNGEADFYENFNNDHHVHRQAHSLTLETDSQGNFYFFKNGNRVPAGVPNHGRLMRVSADGESREVYAYGFRGNNGLHITDDDVILTSDQQGDWVPATRVDIIEQGRFYGHRPHGGQGREIGEYELPICWIPHSVDSSSADAARAPADERFGPLAGQWVHTSYGKAALFALMFEEVDGVRQGGVAPLPLRFETGLMRARFNDRDGQLYLAGMRGWQTVGYRDAAFYRVRYTGEPAHLPIEVRPRREGVTLRFTDPLDAETAEDMERYTAKRWTYLYTGEYGSPEVSLETPADLRAPRGNRPEEGVSYGRDDVTITAALLSDDRREVFLEIPDMQPVKQMMIDYDLRGADGSTVSNTVYHTIHTLGDGVAADR